MKQLSSGIALPRTSHGPSQADVRRRDRRLRLTFLLTGLCAVLCGLHDGRPLVARALAEGRAPGRPGGSPAAAASLVHLRVEDKRLARLLAEGTTESATLRALVEHVESSDLIVYVRYGMTLGERLAGRLAFVTRAGGFRYIDILVKHVGSRIQQIALIGHELQHAVEVAKTPAIVDLASFRHEYERMGHRLHTGAGDSRTVFETDTAVHTAERIVRELLQQTD